MTPDVESVRDDLRDLGSLGGERLTTGELRADNSRGYECCEYEDTLQSDASRLLGDEDNGGVDIGHDGSFRVGVSLQSRKFLRPKKRIHGLLFRTILSHNTLGHEVLSLYNRKKLHRKREYHH